VAALITRSPLCPSEAAASGEACVTLGMGEMKI